MVPALARNDMRRAGFEVEIQLRPIPEQLPAGETGVVRAVIILERAAR